MTRSIILSSLLVFAAAALVRADEAKPVERPVPPIASNAEAKEAVASFKEAYKGKDSAAKADAVDALGDVNHPAVVAELIRLVKHKDPEIRAAAFMGLCEQRALPVLVGKALLATVDAKTTEETYLTDVIDAWKCVRWRGALPTYVTLLHHEKQPVVRWSLDAIGDTKDVRGLDAILDLMKELKVDEGVKWEGGEVHVDTGTAGDADQRAAEAAYHAKYGNKGGRGKAAGRKMRSLGEILYLVLKDLTGENFASGKAAREWVAAHKAEIDGKKQLLDAEEKAQEAASKAAVAAARSGA